MLTDQEIRLLLPTDRPAKVAGRIVHARHLSIETRAQIINALEARLIEEHGGEATPPQSVLREVHRLRAAMSALYAQAEDDLADRKESAAIGDPTTE